MARLKQVACFIPLMLVGALANAAPAVVNVTGTFADGQTVTVTGTGFGNGPNVVIFDDFEKGAGSTGQVIPLTSPKIGQWTKYGQSVGRPRYHSLANSGTHGWAIRDRTYIQYPTDDSNRMGQFWQVLAQPVSEAFISYQVAVPPGTPFSGASTPGTWPSVSSWKFAWLFDGPSGYGSDNLADMCLPTQIGNGSFWFAGNSGNLFSLGNSWWSWNGFNRIAVWLRGNPAGLSTANGNVLFQAVNAEKGMTSIYRTDIPAFPSGASTQWNQLVMPGWWGNGDWRNFDGVYDDVYVATGPNAAARIEIGDAPTYAASKNLTILTPSSWSNSQITATVRTGSFKNFDNTYLFVTDSAGQVSSGIPIECPQCPRPPVSLMVQ
jgi:hypothetical protein